MNTEQERAKLLPCPFCGGGKTEVRENGRPWLGTRWGEPVSVSVRHWCEHVDGQPSRMIERVGRDRAAAIAAWNRRAALQSHKPNVEFEDPRVQLVYGIICGGHEPPEGEHWDGYVSRLIVDALQSQDREDAERYRWLRDSDGLHDLPYEDHGLGPEFPSGEALDAAIDHARRAREGG